MGMAMIIMMIIISMSLIDLHSHLIPRVDDGAQSIEDALTLAQLAVDEGISKLVLTPHHYNPQFINHAQGVIEASRKLQDEINEAGIALKVYPSQEIRIHEQLIDHLYNDDLLCLDEQGRYMLIEFPTQNIPDFSTRILGQLIDLGIRPVIAHPERNHCFAKDFNRLAEFIQMGCIGQVTTSSLAGAFGSTYQDISFQMIEANLCHFMASDCHHKEWRPFNYQVALQVLEKRYSQTKVDEFVNNAEIIFEGRELQMFSVKIPEENKSLWRKVWGFFKEK